MRYLLLLMSMAMTFSLQVSFGQAQESKSESLVSADRMEFMQSQAVAFVGKTADARKIRALDKPLLRWTNPHTNIQDGVLACWVDDAGVPVAAAQICLTPNSTSEWAIEFQSLSSGPLSLGNGAIEQWTPQKAGVKWQPTDQIGKPSPNKKRRLVQMRTLARKFRGDDDFENEESVLRLLTNPLVRYANPKSGVIDGALFALVHGTDPEMLILVEARDSSDETNEGNNAKVQEMRYFWALAPMTSFELRAYLDRKQVWHKPSMTSNTPNDIFFQRLLVSGKKAEKRSRIDSLKSLFGL